MITWCKPGVIEYSNTDFCLLKSLFLQLHHSNTEQLELLILLLYDKHIGIANDE